MAVYSGTRKSLLVQGSGSLELNDQRTTLTLGFQGDGGAGFANQDLHLVRIGGTLTESASGTHGLLTGLRLNTPTVTGGAAGVTATATFYVAGAMTAGSTNYAMWVDAGDSRFDGLVQGDRFTALAASGAFARLVSTEGGTVTYTANSQHTYDAVLKATVAKGTFTGLVSYGALIANPSTTGTGTIDVRYGLYVENQTIGTTNYAIYATGRVAVVTGAGGVAELYLENTTAGQDTEIHLKNPTSDWQIYAAQATDSLRFYEVGQGDRLVLSSAGLHVIGGIGGGVAPDNQGGTLSLSHSSNPYIKIAWTSPSTRSGYLEGTGDVLRIYGIQFGAAIQSWNMSTGENISLVDFKANNAKIGDVGHGANFAGFAHPSSYSTTGYALLQQNNGTTFINAASGMQINFRVNNSNVGFFTATLFVLETADLHINAHYLEIEDRGNSSPNTPGTGKGRIFIRNTGNGTARTLKIRWDDASEDTIATGPNTPADYVFQRHYRGWTDDWQAGAVYGGLLGLGDVEGYVRQHFHLPGPRGGRFDIALAAEKIEEVYLYLFDHEARLRRLEAAVAA